MLVHQMLCMSESSPDVINITDLTELCASWTSDTKLGAEVHLLLEAFKERNLRQRCTEKKQLRLDVVNWLKHVGGEPCSPCGGCQAGTICRAERHAGVGRDGRQKE